MPPRHPTTVILPRENQSFPPNCPSEQSANGGQNHSCKWCCLECPVRQQAIGNLHYAPRRRSLGALSPYPLGGPSAPEECYFPPGLCCSGLGTSAHSEDQAFRECSPPRGHLPHREKATFTGCLVTAGKTTWKVFDKLIAKIKRTCKSYSKQNEGTTLVSGSRPGPVTCRPFLGSCPRPRRAPGTCLRRALPRTSTSLIM